MKPVAVGTAARAKIGGGHGGTAEWDVQSPPAPSWSLALWLVLTENDRDTGCRSEAGPGVDWDAVTALDTGSYPQRQNSERWLFKGVQSHLIPF